MNFCPTAVISLLATTANYQEAQSATAASADETPDRRSRADGVSHLAAGDYVVKREAPTASLERVQAQVEACRIENIER